MKAPRARHAVQTRSPSGGQTEEAPTVEVRLHATSAVPSTSEGRSSIDVVSVPEQSIDQRRILTPSRPGVQPLFMGRRVPRPRPRPPLAACGRCHPYREFAMRYHFVGSRLRLLLPDLRTWALIVCTSFALVTPCARSLASPPGQWTPTPLDPGFTEVHLVLLPAGDGPDHSRILTWDEHGNGKEYGWRTGFDGCGSTAMSSLESPSEWTWAPGANIFCAGHAMLGDGTMLSAGGADVIFAWGIRDGRTFQVGTSSSPGSWLSKPLMNRERFYPTVTTLGSGSRALVSGGGRSPQLWVFGGRRNGNPPVSGSGDLLHRLPKGTDALWEDPVTPQLGSGLTALPDAREGHTAVRLDNTGVGPAQVVFGGKGASGAPVGNDVFLLTRNVTETTIPGSLLADYTYVCSKLPPQGGILPPSPRSDHIAMANNDHTEMLIYGGMDGSGQPLGDFYRLFFNVVSAQWQWAARPEQLGHLRAAITR